MGKLASPLFTSSLNVKAENCEQPWREKKQPLRNPFIFQIFWELILHVRGSPTESPKLESMQACRDTTGPPVGSLCLCLHLWWVSLLFFLQSAQINIHATNMPYPPLMNGRGLERVRECGRGRQRHGGEIIISPPSVNKPTPHYRCMREGCRGRKWWRQYALTYSYCHYLKLAAEHDYP